MATAARQPALAQAPAGRLAPAAEPGPGDNTGMEDEVPPADEGPLVYKINVNGEEHEFEQQAAPELDTPLLWLLREQLKLTGTKYGCGIGQCGACTVHIDDAPVRSCIVPWGVLTPEQKVVTIEGLSRNGTHIVQRAWQAMDVPQCGYCQNGMIMAAAALLKRKPRPTEADIDEAITNLCRCGTYNRVKLAIRLVTQAQGQTRRRSVPQPGDPE